MTDQDLTTHDSYDDDLALAEALVANARGLPDDAYAQRDTQEAKHVGDSLNNAWVAGITVTEWIRRAGL